MTFMRNTMMGCLAGVVATICAAQTSPAPQKQPVTPQQSGFMQVPRELVGAKGEGGIQPPTHGTRQAKKKKKPQNQQRSQQQQAALKAQQQRQALTAAELQKSTVQARTQETTGTPAARAQPAPPPKPPRPSVPGR